MKLNSVALISGTMLAARTIRPVAFDGDGQPPAPPQITPEMQAVIDRLVEEKTTGLKAKNNELLGLQRQLKDDLKKFEGIDPEAVRSILAKFSNDEEAALIAKGEIDKVLERRTERMNQEWQRKLDKQLQEQERIKKANQKLADRALAQGITQAAIKAGALPEAVEDLTLRAKGSGWTVDDDGELVARQGDEVILGKDGKTPLSPIEWAESLRDTAPHLWPKAQGSNAPGGAATKGGPDLSKLPPAERINAARAAAAGSNR